MKTIIFLFLFFLTTSIVATDQWKVADPQNSNNSCYVRISFRYDVKANKCRFYHDVMIGITALDPLTIRCGRLDVDCRSNEGSDTKDNQQE